MNLLLLRKLLSEGGSIVVKCIKTAVKDNTTFTGEWIIFGVGEDSSFDDNENNWGVLVTQKTLEPRIVRTTTGLIAIGLDLGFSTVDLPLFEGERGYWVPK